MKNKIKVKAILFLILALLLSSSNISFAKQITGSTQINTRGLIFNTGISSDQIRLLKDFFRAEKQSNVPWGYRYDDRTKELVRDYQKSRGLKVDGVAGTSTIDAINGEIKDKNLKIGLRIPVIDKSGDLILINKSSNTLYFLKDGNIQSSYPVATGKTTDLTPNGQFKIVIKFKNPRWGGAGVSDPVAGGDPENPLGTRWIGISFGGGGKYGVHGNSNPRSIGTYASLGCVRMFNKDVEELYENVKINTPIWIGNESLLESYGVEFIHDYKQGKEKEEKTISINLNGEKLELKNPVINKNGTTYYPFREILESIEAIVMWDEENGKAIGILGEKFVEFKLGENRYRDDEGFKYLPENKQVFSTGGKTYVPIRNLMESLGHSVTWDQTNKTIIIENMAEDGGTDAFWED